MTRHLTPSDAQVLGDLGNSFFLVAQLGFKQVAANMKILLCEVSFRIQALYTSYCSIHLFFVRQHWVTTLSPALILVFQGITSSRSLEFWLGFFLGGGVNLVVLLSLLYGAILAM